MGGQLVLTSGLQTAGRMRREGGRPPDQYIVSNINPRPARPPLHIQPPQPPALAPYCPAAHVLMQKGGSPGGPWQGAGLISSWDMSGHTARARRTTNTNVAKPPPNLSLSLANELCFFCLSRRPYSTFCSTLAQIVFKWTFCTRRRN